MIIAVCLFLAVLSRTLMEGGTIEVKVRCDDKAKIYIDEQKVGQTDGWTEVWTGKQISGKSRLIAIECYNKKGPGGLVASFGERVVTDETWRCRASGSDWYALDTDESSGSWSDAHVIPSESDDYGDTWNTFPGSAKWIWRGSYIRNSYSLCRKALGVSIDHKFNDYGIVYADGIHMFSEDTDVQGRNIVPRTTRLIAIKGWKASQSFIEAAFSNGFGTDTSWKCSDNGDTNWETVDYDDDHWDQAVDRGQNDIGADSKVRKIWTNNLDNGHIFCRGRIECGCEHLCEPDENEYDFRCACPEGYVVGRDGLSCDKDECQEQNAGCGHICVNIDGSYQCECRQGYELSTDKHSCININECERNSHNCTGICKDTEGAFECSCLEGFALHEDKTSCGDINECKENNGNCDQGCSNTYGNYTCYCSVGYKLADDLDSCSNINECEKGTHNCTSTMLCQDTEGAFNCVCPVGYTMDTDMATCQDINECGAQDHPCDEGCINTVGSYMCNCSDGYSLANDGHACLISGDGGGVNTGMIAGIVVAFILIFILAGLLVIFLIRRRKKQKDNKKERSQDPQAHVYYNVGRDISAEDTARAQTKEVPHVYYNVGREMSPPEAVKTPYEDVDRLRLKYGGSEQVGVGVSGLPTPPAKPVPQPRSLAHQPTPSLGEDAPDRSLPPKLLKEYAEYPTTRPRHQQNIEKPPNEVRRNPDVESQQDSSSSEDPDDEVDEILAAPAKRAADNVYSNVASDELLTKPIKVAGLAEYVRDMLERDRFLDEFEKLPSGQRGQCLVCNRQGIRKKLRFKNIKPYDHSIVPLEKTETAPLSDFINASFVHGYHKPNFFIATQGPKNTTLNDFWRMIWQHNVGIITMLTSCFEGGNEKCWQYWPDHSKQTFGNVCVETVDQQITADFTLRTFVIQKGSEKRSVKHFHYTTWPDQSVPDDGTSLIALRRKIKEAEKAMGPPVVVHCSAGVGRTGAYIALDYLLEQAEAEGVVDVCGCVNLMRENRMNMIQTSLQYKFLHTTLLEAITVGHTSVPCSEFLIRLSIMKKKHPQTKKTGLQDQFKLLDTLRQPLANYSFETAGLPENQIKNRNSAICPADSQFLHLQPTAWTKSDYINAVFVDGYRARYEFIVTQMPLINTKGDLWRLVNDYNISTVVMLNEATENSEEVYFPCTETPLTIGHVTVDLKDTEATSCLIRRNLTVKTQRGIKSVTHISSTKCLISKPLKEGIPTLTALVKEVQKLKQKQTKAGPVLIHCLDGVESSGLFCAAYLMLDKINAESEVDVFNAVKKIRTDRPHFVTSEDQYSFLHDVATEYIDSFDLYANFK